MVSLVLRRISGASGENFPGIETRKNLDKCSGQARHPWRIPGVTMDRLRRKDRDEFDG